MSTSQINLETDSNHMAVIKIGFYFHGYAISINWGGLRLKRNLSSVRSPSNQISSSKLNSME